jgi:nucleolin
VRAERKAKRKREEEEAKAKKQKNASREDVEKTAGSSDAAAMTHSRIAEVKSSAIDFGAVARFDPDAASSSDSESVLEGTGDDEKKGDDDDDASMKKNEEASSKETQTRLRETSTTDQKAAEAQLRKRQVYLGGVPFHKTEDEIRGAFEEENLPVEKIDCMTFPDSGRFRGIAILTFATREAAKGALAWNGEEWDGTFLTVKKYAPKERREEGADGGGGGGSGGDGGKKGCGP